MTGRRLEAMRVISKQVDHYREEERKLLPRWGTIGIGGADFDWTLKATVAEAYLRILRRGGTPEEALAEAIDDGDHCVRTWNTHTSTGRVCINSPHELKRWSGAGKAAAEDVHRVYLGLLTGG